MKTKEQREEAERKRKERELELKNKALAFKADMRVISQKKGWDDLITRITAFRDGHLQTAKDGVRLKSKDSDEQVQLSNEERLSNLDRAAGIDEILALIERALS